MTDPERLLIGGSELERSLLGSVVGEKPSALLVAQMEQGLGLSTASASVLSGKILALVLGTGAAGGLALGIVATTDIGEHPLSATENTVAEALLPEEAETPPAPLVEVAPHAHALEGTDLPLDDALDEDQTRVPGAAAAQRSQPVSQPSIPDISSCQQRPPISRRLDEP